LRDNRQIDQLVERLKGSLVVKTSPACVLLDAIRHASSGA
jgi:hypothetical protein